MFASTLFVIPLCATFATAICPGFIYGIGNEQKLDRGINRWTVYDNSCTPVDDLTTNQNPCEASIFSCSPPPLIFDGYTNTFTHLRYTCGTDPNSGVCGSDAISVCCSNDSN